jgi:hypothetical protein
MSLFQGMGMEAPVDIAEQLVTRREEVRGEGRNMTDEEVITLLQDIAGVTQEEGPSLEETMRDIQNSGEAIMRDQLTAMQNAATFAMAEFGISSSMSVLASNFYRTQQTETANIARYMRTSAMGTAVMAANDIRRAASENLATGDVGGWLDRLMTGFTEQAMSMGSEFAPTGPPPEPEPGFHRRVFGFIQRFTAPGETRRTRAQARRRAEEAEDPAGQPLVRRSQEGQQQAIGARTGPPPSGTVHRIPLTYIAARGPGGGG